MALDELTETQREAADMLADGTPEADVADELDVERSRLEAWVDEHPYFEGALNRRREAKQRETADRLRSLLPKALDALEEHLEGGDVSPEAAMKLLEMAGYDQFRDMFAGKTDGEAILKAEAQARAGDEFEVINDLMDGVDQEQDALEQELAEKFDGAESAE